MSLDAATLSHHRDALVAEVDLALAALRRVIVKAIDCKQSSFYMPPLSDGQKKIQSPIQEMHPISAAGITIDLDNRSISCNGAVLTLKRRQVQLVAVLAKASPNFMVRMVAAARAWPDLSESSREVTLGPIVRDLARKLSPIGVNIESVRGTGLRLWVGEGEVE